MSKHWSGDLLENSCFICHPSLVYLSFLVSSFCRCRNSYTIIILEGDLEGINLEAFSLKGENRRLEMESRIQKRITLVDVVNSLNVLNKIVLDE